MKPFAATLQLSRQSLAIEFASSRLGRVLLHSYCLVRHPARARWHWSGILREITG